MSFFGSISPCSYEEYMREMQRNQYEMMLNANLQRPIQLLNQKQSQQEVSTNPLLLLED